MDTSHVAKILKKIEDYESTRIWFEKFSQFVTQDHKEFNTILIKPHRGGTIGGVTLASQIIIEQIQNAYPDLIYRSIVQCNTEIDKLKKELIVEVNRL